MSTDTNHAGVGAYYQHALYSFRPSCAPTSITALTATTTAAIRSGARLAIELA